MPSMTKSIVLSDICKSIKQFNSACCRCKFQKRFFFYLAIILWTNDDCFSFNLSLNESLLIVYYEFLFLDFFLLDQDFNT